MPVCSRCDIAYLPGEHHACLAARRGGAALRVLGGLLVGAGLIFFLRGYAVQNSPNGRVWLPVLMSVLVMPLSVVSMCVGVVLLLKRPR